MVDTIQISRISYPYLFRFYLINDERGNLKDYHHCKILDDFILFPLLIKLFYVELIQKNS